MLGNLFLHVALLVAEWVMWLLIGINFLSIALTIERGLYFRSRRLTIDLTDLMQRGSFREAMQLVADSRVPECPGHSRRLAAIDARTTSHGGTDARR